MKLLFIIFTFITSIAYANTRFDVRIKHSKGFKTNIMKHSALLDSNDEIIVEFPDEEMKIKLQANEIAEGVYETITHIYEYKNGKERLILTPSALVKNNQERFIQAENKLNKVELRLTSSNEI